METIINCKMCFEDIFDETKVKYRLSNTDTFKDFDYCINCLELLMKNLWEKYISSLKKADCEKSLLSIISTGPPVNFRDVKIEDNKEIYEFYYHGKIQSAKLKGSLSIDQRITLHNKLLDVVKNIKNNYNESIDDFDYISNIDKILKEYKLYA